MKKVNYISGDLVKLAKDGRFDIIAHGCNCQKNMGAGIAKTIAKVFPDAQKADTDFPNPKLGEYSIGYDGDLIILNLYTQINIGKSFDSPNPHWSQKFSNDTTINRYAAIKDCFQKINKQFNGMSIGLPMIGAGLAGLEWKTIENYIAVYLEDMDVTVVKFDK